MHISDHVFTDVIVDVVVDGDGDGDELSAGSASSLEPRVAGFADEIVAVAVAVAVNDHDHDHDHDYDYDYDYDYERMKTSLNPNVDVMGHASYRSQVIPLRDARETQSAPVLTYALVALNAGVFAYRSWLSEESAARFIEVFGWTPSHVFDREHPAALLTLLTSMFVHGSWFHVLSNLWCLYAFGAVVEDWLGKARFAAFYVCAALGAAGAQLMIDPWGEIPMIGASGAIAGLLAAYWKSFPSGRVLALIPLLFVFVREVPAVYFISLWFILQLLAGFFGLMGPNEGAIVFFANIGGFLTGLMLTAFFKPARNQTRGFKKPGYY